MNGLLHRITLAMAISMAMVPWLQAQDYTLIPGDSIVEQILPDDLSVFNFLQENTTTDTLHLSWEKVSDDVPDDWIALICDNSICYPDLKENGTMLPVVPGEYGLLSLHITATGSGGIAIIRYAVWETSNEMEKDTLTWVIQSVNTGQETLETNDLYHFTAGEQLIIHSSQALNGSARMMNMQGAVCVKTTFSGFKNYFDISKLTTGIYILELTAAASTLRSKIWIQ